MLKNDVERYLSLRRTLGFRLHSTADNLRAFARFATDQGDTRIRSNTAVDWASSASSPGVRHVRLRDVLLLARFLRAEDAAHELPPQRLFPIRVIRRPPYIYTPEEVGRLLVAAGGLSRSYPLRREVYRTMLGLIASTGLRLSEALDLRLDDMLPGGVLRVRKGKFGKSRLLPLHPTTIAALHSYLGARQTAAIPGDHLFVSVSGARIASSTVDYTFGRLLRLAGITPEGDRRPRLHDLRHTFATRSLEHCSTRRESVARHFVALSTYLGHVDIASTYWYLEATPELLAHIAAAGETGRPEFIMTPVAPLITDFLRTYLPVERGCSPHTCDSYAHAFRLLFTFAADRLGKRPSQLCLEDLDAQLVLAFLAHIEENRRNLPSSRNARLAAVKAFMRYVEFREPAALAQVRQNLAIPSKRHDKPLIAHLVIDEIQAILKAPDTSTRLGVRDRAMLHLCFAAALRVSELVTLSLSSLSLRPTVSLRIHGKGRRERCLPLWKETTADLRAWLAVRGQVQAPELFVSATGAPMSRAGFEYILDKHVQTAAAACPSLEGRSISPHQLRHSCALVMLQATRDIRKVALWLGHADVRTTEIYLRVDPTEKLEAVEAVVPPALRRGRFKAPDALIASLRDSGLCRVRRDAKPLRAGLPASNSA